MSSDLRLVDCHAHLEELEDPEAAIERAGKSGVLSIVAVGSDLESNQRVLSLSGRHGEVTVYAALGIHPWRLEGRDLEQDLAFVEKNLVRAVAIGEVGLDFWLKESRKDPLHRERQEVVFRRLLSLGRDLSKPVIIHARGAWAECLGIALEEQVSKAVFHWFSGPLEILRELLNHGYLISATPAAQYSDKHQSALREAPLESILLETDSPVIYEGRRSEPADVVRTLQAVARVKRIPEPEVAEVTTKNAVRFFDLSGPGCGPGHSTAGCRGSSATG
ncbi:MAG TPA: TatD family hydrolase [Desulfatiglandales bacterium]|nr:TatD family hydrolase [Desulfatiglandales bacterium]